MKRTTGLWLILALLTGAAAAFAQHAAESHGESGASASSVLMWKWANFAILAGLIGYFVYRKAGAFFRSRTDSIRIGIEEAGRLRDEAEARAAEIESRMLNLQGEIDALRQAARTEMAAENERLRRETSAGIEKVRRQAEQEIASAAKTARHEVQAHAAKLALELAAARIRNSMTAASDDILVSSFLEALETNDGKSHKELN